MDPEFLKPNIEKIILFLVVYVIIPYPMFWPTSMGGIEYIPFWLVGFVGSVVLLILLKASSVTFAIFFLGFVYAIISYLMACSAIRFYKNV